MTGPLLSMIRPARAPQPAVGEYAMHLTMSHSLPG
jgi:hypothetical protein